MKNYLSPCIILMSLFYACHAYPEVKVGDSLLMQMFFKMFGSSSSKRSDSYLMEIFSEISDDTGVYPDDRRPENYLLIVNELTDHCMYVKGGEEVAIGQHIITYPCDFHSNVPSQRFYIHHVGDGYVGLSTELGTSTCIGVGYDEGSSLYTGDWCDSPSHQFAIYSNFTYDYDYINFQQRETGRFLTASANPDVDDAFITVDDFDRYDTAQRWRFCGHDGTRCWPSPRPSKMSARY